MFKCCFKGMIIRGGVDEAIADILNTLGDM